MSLIKASAKPRITWAARLKSDVITFHTKSGVKYEIIGARALKNRRFWERFIDGGTVTLESADRLYAWMET